MEKTKKNLDDLLKDVDTSHMGRCNISELIYKAQMEAKITHLMNRDKTYARHEAFDIFYGEIDDIADNFTETFKAIYPLNDIVISECRCIEDPLSYFKNLYAQIEVERKYIPEQFIQSNIDDIQNSVAHVIYRLENITT